MDDLKSFNEMIKELDGAQSTNTGSEMNELAQKLLAQGIATSPMEAKQKAREMLGTEHQAQKSFDKKKETQTMYNDPRSNADYYKQQNIEELRKRAMSGPRKIEVQDRFQTPGFERSNGSLGLPNAVPGINREKQGAANAGWTAPKPRVEHAPEPVQQAPEQWPVMRPDQPEPAPRPTPQPIARPEPEPAPKPEPRPMTHQTPQEEQRRAPDAETNTPEKPEPKKSKLPEVDINNIFNFGKR